MDQFHEDVGGAHSAFLFLKAMMGGISGVWHFLCALLPLLTGGIEIIFMTSSLNVAISASPRGNSSLAFHKILLLLLKCH